MFYISAFNVFYYRVTVLGVLLGILQWDRSVMCIFLLWEYILGYLVLFIVSMVVEFSICFLATRGSILDTAVRAPMQYILYIRLCKYLLRKHIISFLHVTLYIFCMNDIRIINFFRDTMCYKPFQSSKGQHS